jgi:hypothetical protein
MQLFVLLYIEGGSYIQEDEETWEFAVLYVSVFSLHYACWNQFTLAGTRSGVGPVHQTS